jgi:hypothetical protein
MPLANRMKKNFYLEVYITYINNEVEDFLKRIDPEAIKRYDKLGAWEKLEK